MSGRGIGCGALFAFPVALVVLNCLGALAGGGGPRGWGAIIVAGVAALAAIAVIALRMRRDRRRLSDYDAEIHGVCPGCGYDLRATPGRCPECGRVVASGSPE